MTDRPKRFKGREDYTIDEELRAQQAARRGETVRFESDEYKKARRQVLEDAGFEPDEPADDKALEEMSVGDHFERIRRGRA